MKLSDRLFACASLVQPGNPAVDIGTDHGYLPIYLLKNGICPTVIAADLREKPLQAARDNAARFGVTDNISFSLSNGLEKIPVESVRTIICAGMGGDLIKEILMNANETWTPEYQFILQPQSAVHELREFLTNNGFEIKREKLARDGRFVYSVMDVRYGEGRPTSLGQYFLPRYLKSDPLYGDYAHRVKTGITQTIQNLRLAKTPQTGKLEYFQLALDEILEMEAEA